MESQKLSPEPDARPSAAVPDEGGESRGRALCIVEVA